MLKVSGNRVGSNEIASMLRREINQGTLLRNERLPSERSLADEHDVARGTIREAFNLLAKEGLVTTRRGSGTFVTFNGIESSNPIIENARPLELIDTRFALEPHICRLAVLHASNEDFNHSEELLI